MVIIIAAAAIACRLLWRWRQKLHDRRRRHWSSAESHYIDDHSQPTSASWNVLLVETALLSDADELRRQAQLMTPWLP